MFQSPTIYSKTVNWACKKLEIVIMFRQILVQHRSWLQHVYQIKVNSREEACIGIFVIYQST